MPRSLTSHYADLVRQRVAQWPGEPGVGEVNDLLRALGRWRSHMIANT